MLRAIATASAAAALALTGVPAAMAATAPASAGHVTPAAGGCWLDTDPNPGLFYCYNRTHVVTYAYASWSSTKTGWLESSPSWFVCWTDRGDANASGTIWFRTQADTTLNGSDGWGWIPGSEVSYTFLDPDYECAGG